MSTLLKRRSVFWRARRDSHFAVLCGLAASCVWQNVHFFCEEMRRNGGIRILPFCAAWRHYAFGKMCISSAKKCAEMGGFSSLADAKTERRKSDALFFGAPKGIRTPDLPLRSDLGIQLLSHFLCPIIPYFQGFFTL